QTQQSHDFVYSGVSKHFKQRASLLSLRPNGGRAMASGSRKWWLVKVNNALSLVSVGGIVPHHWCQWEE
ncbi:unnamed protein product, partial [Staurois parvus]